MKDILSSPRVLNLLSSISLIALIFLCVAWETVLAPLQPGQSRMVFKVVPLLFGVFGILRGKRYTHQWVCMLALLYFTEGSVRAMSDHGMQATLAMIEVVLSVTLFASCAAYARVTRTPAAPLSNTAD